ncbi:hypothetical protein BX616_008094 [Lobosporangium transversale]|nr:hypothetical protein BX616_008094 [Lobosporangium transversale]
MPWVAKLFLLPYTEDICNHKAIRNYFSKKNIESLRNEFKNEKHVPASVEEAAEILDLQFRYHPGYARGLMLTLKKFPFSGLFPQFASLQDHTFPVQVIWGTRDKVVPGTTVETLQKLVPRIKVTKVEGATHSIVMTHPETIIKQLEGFVC